MIPTLIGGVSSQSIFNSASGGTETTIADYNGTGETWKVHTFTSSGTLTVISAPGAFSFSVLVVAGGGGGAGGGPYFQGGGGGGAGGMLVSSTATFSATSYAITVGNGGAGGEGARSGFHNGVPGGQGGNSSIGSEFLAYGGGGGESYQGAGSSGGSGGGRYAQRSGGYAGVAGQGNSGGSGGNPYGGNGGGRGANGDSGGTGLASDITGSSVTYAYGGRCADSAGPSGPANTGAGGWGTRAGYPTSGGNGGSGIVVVAYRIN